MRVFNFSAGPAMLPLEVLERVRDELIDWRSSGASVMEISHRSKAFIGVAEQAETDVRELLGIGSNYRVLFLQGGATGQFSAIPMNLAPPGATVDYVNTGHWSKKALTEARRYCEVHVAADAAASGYTSIPSVSEWQRSANAAYLHYTPNETIGGVEFHFIPDVGRVPLVADMSSTLLSRPLDVSRFGLIYAGAQKNMGPSGITLVIVRDDLLGRARPGTPLVLDYQAMANEGSMLNTPPTFAWYIAGLVFDWLKRLGGLARMAEINRAKADKLYEAIDRSQFYKNGVARDCRSWTNVTFTLARPELDKQFLDEAKAAGLTNLAGHRAVGGMRASLYNAMPLAGVTALVEFMQDFEKRRG
jgi:phosphoserine aminotransferase